MRLALHLENQQSVVFGDHSDIPDILSVEKHPTLTGSWYHDWPSVLRSSWRGREILFEDTLKPCHWLYQDIRTLPDGTLCHTLKEAACQRGLLEDDNEYDLCLASQLHGICLRKYAIYSLPFRSITILVIRLYFEKNISILSLMTFFIVLENPCPVLMLMNTF